MKRNGLSQTVSQEERKRQEVCFLLSRGFRAPKSVCMCFLPTVCTGSVSSLKMYSFCSFCIRGMWSLSKETTPKSPESPVPFGPRAWGEWWWQCYQGDLLGRMWISGLRGYLFTVPTWGRDVKLASVANFGGSAVDFVKELDEFLTQDVGAYPHMWVGFSSLMNIYQVKDCVPDPKHFCKSVLRSFLRHWWKQTGRLVEWAELLSVVWV